MDRLIIGRGNYIIGGIVSDGMEGVVVFSDPNHGRPIDSIAPTPKNSDLICAILFENMKGARLFQDQVNAAVMRMNNYKVENEKE
jgi:hypothetical protein